MRKKDPKRMEDIIKFVNSYTIHYNSSPSTREIAEELGICNSTVYRYLLEMDERGLVSYDGSNIETEVTRKRDSEHISAAIVGSVSCGVPLLEEENIESYISLPASLFERGEYFLLKANGESMIEAGIDDGDMIIVKRTFEALDGDIAVVLLSDGSTTLKRFYRDKEKHLIVLHPENKNMEDIIVKECYIQGIAVKVLKDLV